MTLLEKIKLSLRITTTTFDTELNVLISACILDLNIAGVDGTPITTSTTDPLVQQAIIAYCKWRFGEPSDPEQSQKLYELQKAQLAMADGYTTFPEE